MITGDGLVLRTAGPDPGDRAQAPGSLGLVQALVNTLNAHTHEDLLASPPAATAWLRAAGVLPPGAHLTAGEASLLTGLREAIRAALIAHTHAAPGGPAEHRLELALLPSRLAVTADAAGGFRLASADQHPFARALGAFAVAVAEATIAGTWPRLKACPGRRCGWAFYDRSPAARSRWCSMQVCGARAKARAYRERRPRQLPGPG